MVISLLLFYQPFLNAQTRIPEILVPGIEGGEFSISDIAENGKPTIIIFWATWCKPCINELDNIAYYYPEWTEEAEFNIVTVCTDDSRSSASIRSFVKSRGWPFIGLIDVNQDVKRLMNVTDVPHYFIFSADKSLIKTHTGYLPGDEDIMYEEIKKLQK